MEMSKGKPDCLQVEFNTISEMYDLGFGSPIAENGILLIYPIEFEQEFIKKGIRFSKRNLQRFQLAKREHIGSLLARK